MTATTPPHTVLVAGGTGFLGAAIVRALTGRGHRVTVLSRRPGSVARRFAGLEVAARGGDITDPSTLPEAVAGMDVVIQAAQFPGFPVEDPGRGRTFREVDGRGTANLVAAAKGAGVGRLVYLSGVGVDSPSGRPWFEAKRMAEAAVTGSGISCTIVRPSWVYGPEDRSLNVFARVLRLVPWVFPQLGPGDQKIDPVWVGDLSEAVCRSLETPAALGATFDIGGPITYTMDAIVATLMSALRLRKPIVHVPMGLLRTGAALAELLPGQVFSRGALEFATQGAVADLASLRRVLPDLPLLSMPEALERYEPGGGG